MPAQWKQRQRGVRSSCFEEERTAGQVQREPFAHRWNDTGSSHNPPGRVKSSDPVGSRLYACHPGYNNLLIYS